MPLNSFFPEECHGTQQRGRSGGTPAPNERLHKTCIRYQQPKIKANILWALVPDFATKAASPSPVALGLLESLLSSNAVRRLAVSSNGGLHQVQTLVLQSMSLLRVRTDITILALPLLWSRLLVLAPTIYLMDPQLPICIALDRSSSRVEARTR